VADRSGFTASALRYCEEIGLVAPTARTDAGYRVYDDRTLARLAFIARAKQLGCSLGEIADLVAVWDGEFCGPVQRRFHELVTTKIRGVEHHVSALNTFASELQSAAEQLSGEPIDGRCDNDCACVTASSGPAAAVPATLLAEPDDLPVVCTLEPGAMPQRLADWRAVADQVRARTATADGGVRLELADAIDVGELARLVAAEQRCCAFLSFALTVDHRGIGLEVRGPDAAAGIVELFGR